MKSFFFFPFSFCICIGKWGVNVSFDVSKSSFAQLQRYGDLSRMGGRVKESTAAVLVRYYRYMCCTLSLNNQLRRRPWLQTLSVLLQFTSPVFTKYLLSSNTPLQCKRLSLTPNPRTPKPTILWAFSTSTYWLVGLNFKSWTGKEKSNWPLTPATLQHRGSTVTCKWCCSQKHTVQFVVLQLVLYFRSCYTREDTQESASLSYYKDMKSKGKQFPPNT